LRIFFYVENIKMFNYIFFLVEFIGLLKNSFSQCAQGDVITFQKTYGGSGNERAHSIQLTADGGYIVAGETTSFGAGSKDWFVMKINADGIEQWTKTYGSTSADDGNSITIKQTSDLGFIVAGHTESFGAGSFYDSYVIRLNNSGNVLWEKRMTGSSWDSFRDVIELSNGDFLFTGTGISNTNGNADAHLVRVSSSGNLIWIKNTGTISREHSQSVIELSNGDILFSGPSNFSDPGSSTANAYVAKIDQNGNFIQAKQYGLTSFYDDFNEIRLLSDGNILNVGITKSYGAGDYDIWLVKTDVNGNVIWTKTYGGSGVDIGVNVREKTNGELVVSGYTSSFGNGNELLIINTDGLGNVLWSNKYGGVIDEETDWWGKSMDLTPTDEIIIVGETKSFGAGNEDIYIVKTNECGDSFCNEQSVVVNVTSPLVSSSGLILGSVTGGAG
jgi:hypothetical protein